MDRHLFDKWLAVAEKRAGLPKLRGGLWHPYRRKWVTERSHHPINHVAEAGGWVDYHTILTCYDQPDKGAMRSVMDEPRKLTAQGLRDPQAEETRTKLERSAEQ